MSRPSLPRWWRVDRKTAREVFVRGLPVTMAPASWTRTKSLVDGFPMAREVDFVDQVAEVSYRFGCTVCFYVHTTKVNLTGMAFPC